MGNVYIIPLLLKYKLKRLTLGGLSFSKLGTRGDVNPYKQELFLHVGNGVPKAKSINYFTIMPQEYHQTSPGVRLS